MADQRNSVHLNDEEWLSLAEAGGDAAARQHLAECRECAAELERLRAVLAGYQRTAQEAADHPESFWLRQRARIISRTRGRRAAPRLAWAVSVAALLLGAMLLGRQTPPAPAGGASAAVSTRLAQTDPLSDSALLIAVHQSVQRDVPEALEPAALLVEEMNQNAAQNRNP